MIDIKYILKEKDFLQANLYHFKNDGKLKQIILKTWFAYLFIISMLIAFLLWKDEMLMALILFCILLIISFFHSGRMKRHYIHHYKKLLKAYESRFDKEVRLKINDSHLHYESVAGQSDVFLSQISSMSETENHFFIKLKIETVIIPKAGIENVNRLRDDLISLARNLNLNYHEDLSWKW
ncbi:hypothetical protein [Pedobacter sp. Leaf250]|uniref:hypothetical protein n=1 Tax=Pedobacter sp. Leaf250 TaxID=2876559 RepID=UPI001E3A1ECE|nr:hypothetical protein [Pedobacter sp. Leaf250]